MVHRLSVNVAELLARPPSDAAAAKVPAVTWRDVTAAAPEGARRRAGNTDERARGLKAPPGGERETPRCVVCEDRVRYDIRVCPAGAALVCRSRSGSPVAAPRRLGLVGAGERDHAAADAGGARAARTRRLAGAVAHPAVPGGWGPRRRREAVGAAWLSPPGAAAARHRQDPD